jgi:hypothetical protein
MTLHDVNIFVKLIIEQQANELVENVGIINDENCKYLVNATAVKERQLADHK